jgi:glycosyltransferase involved in cell wall biosynthesis
MNNAKELEGYCQRVHLFKTCAIPEARSARKYPLLMRRYYSDYAIVQISEMLREEKFDLIHVEGYYLMQLLPSISCSNFPVLLVEHNMEYKLSLQRMLLCSCIQEAYIHWQDYYQTLYWERYYWRKATKTITLTSEDAECIKRLEPTADVELIPNGIDHDFAIDHVMEPPSSNFSNLLEFSGEIISNNETPSILFVGNFLYYPNVDAILFFCKRIFPLILQEVSNAKLLIVGSSPPAEVRALEAENRDNVVVTGYVSSLYPFYKYAKVVVCPLRIGGGIKVKIIEALRAGKAIVSTSVGAQGIKISDRLLFVSDRISDFANNVIKLLSDNELRHNQELNTLQCMKTMPKWEQVEEAYVRCYNEMY